MNLRLTLRFGNLETLQGSSGVAKLMDSMLMRGTKSRSRQEIADELNKYRAELTVSTRSPGTLSLNLKAKRENLIPLLDLIADILSNPAFPASELEILKRQAVASYEQQQSDPQMLAQVAVLQTLRPYAEGDPRAYAGIKENIALIEATSVDDLKAFHEQFVSGASGELTVIGDFDTGEVSGFRRVARKATWESRFRKVAQAKHTRSTRV